MRCVVTRRGDERGERTLFAELPEPRATNDIDVFLRADLLADRASIAALVDAIRRLGYVPVETAVTPLPGAPYTDADADRVFGEGGSEYL